jgi:hypothetical protein
LQIGEVVAVDEHCLKSFTCDLVVAKPNLSQIGEFVAIEKQRLKSLTCDLIVA